MIKCPTCGYLQVGRDPSVHVRYCEPFFFKTIVDAEKEKRESETTSDDNRKRTKKM
jgi:hypothetical protein